MMAVEKEAGTAHFDILLDGVELPTLTFTYSGPSIISAAFTGNKSGIDVKYRENTTVGTLINSITVNGADMFGNTTSTTADLYQYGKDPSIGVDDIGIPNTQSVTTKFVSTDGVEDLTVNITGDVVITNYTLVPVNGGYELTITSEDNLNDLPLYSKALFTGVVTTGRYEGQTITKEVNVIKYGKEGRIVPNPSEVTIKKAGRNVGIEILYNNIQVDTVTSTMGTFNEDKSVLTVFVDANPTNFDRVITVEITGLDYNGTEKSATVTITQYGIDPYIAIIPESQTIAYDQANATYTVTAYKVGNLSVSFEGAIIINNYTLENDTLTVSTGDNLEELSLMDYITVSGISEIDEAVTATATLIKLGMSGGIIIQPNYTIANNSSKKGVLVVPYVTDRVDDDSICAFVDNNSIQIDEVLVNKDAKVIVVRYLNNDSNEERVATLTVTGIDDDGFPKMAKSKITQLNSSYNFIIDPSETYLFGSSNSFGVNSSNIGNILSFDSYGDVDGSASFNRSVNGTINMTYLPNIDDYTKYYVLDTTGSSSSGVVTTDAYTLQLVSNYNDYVFELNDSTLETVDIDGGGSKLYYDIISALGTDAIDYDVAGMILTGDFPVLPEVRYKKGYPYVFVPINPTEEKREVVVYFKQRKSHKLLRVVIRQEEGAIPSVSPIWKDFTNTSEAGDYIEYHIKYDGDIAYAGRAYCYPEEDTITWTINDVVSNYLGNGIYFRNGIYEIPDYSKDFFMKTSMEDKYVETFYNS